MKQEARKRRYARKRKCPFKMRKSVVADSCSDDVRLDHVINTETASTATSNQENNVGQENLSSCRVSQLAHMDNKILTREKSKNLGITSSKDLQKCAGNKIISIDILNSVLSTLPGIGMQ